MENTKIKPLLAFTHDQVTSMLLTDVAFASLIAEMLGWHQKEVFQYTGSVRFEDMTVSNAITLANHLRKASEPKHIPGTFTIRPDAILCKADQLALLELWVDGKVQDDNVSHSKLTPGCVYKVGGDANIVDFLERLKGIVHEKFHQEGAESVREAVRKGVENFVNSL